jgi:type IV secretion system protein VirB9
MDTGRIVTGRIVIGRFLVLACAASLLGGCAVLRGHALAPSPAVAAAVPAPAAPQPQPPPPSRPTLVSMAPIADPAPSATPPAHTACVASHHARHRHARRRCERTVTAGMAAISAANRAARETSRPQGFVGGVQVFAYDPGRVYEVWTAPLRVTTLTLAPGETIVSKAAGDTVRWQIGETTSGEGPSKRAHVMIKPLQQGLETNLVLSTSERVYLIELKSGPADAFNAAVTWDLGAVLPPATPQARTAETQPQPLVTPQGPLDARYRIEAKGHTPAWAPAAVMTDGARTFLRFPSDLSSHETPALFAVGPDGASQLVNYRQQGGLWVVDRVLDRAELRLGEKHAQVVKIERASGASS